jgi:cytochrome c oxidase cbb3-type subunit III
MNCVGCHSHGGGGMGPALMDDEWRYGGRIDQIAASIAEGRPNGMPAWRNKLTDQQIWQLAAYVRTLSGQAPKDAVSARADEVSNTAPQTQTKREPVKPSDSAQQ